MFGIEADWSGTKLNGTQTIVPPGSGVITFTETTKSLVSIRGRAGVTVLPNLLLYVTAGTAWNHTDYAGLHSFPACPTNCSIAAFSSTNFGWVSGTGLEWAMWNSTWTARVEGLYYILSGANPGGVLPGTVAQNSVWYWNNLGVAARRAGLSYKF